MTTRRWKCVFLTCAAVVLLAWTPAGTQDAPPPAVAGDWQGAIGRQRLALKIEQAPGVPLKATLFVVDQGNAAIPADTATMDARGSLHLELKSLGAAYEGALSADGAQIAGTWQQNGAALPLVFRRPGVSVSAAFTLKPRTQGRVALQPCRTADGNAEALCGKYDVFENRQSRQGRKIALNIMLLPAASAKPEPDPFFGLAGGPGQSATESFPLAGYVAKVRELRDVVLVDQRGTGQSNPLPCTLQSAQDAQAMLGEPYSLDKIRQCRADSDGKADTTQYTTSIAADDLDEVREAMGYDKIDVFGGSYGTKAALVYLRRHGEHVRTVALEAVASPQYLIPLPFARALQSSIDGVFALCAADAACHAAYAHLREEFTAVLDRLGASPATFQINNQSVTLSREMFLSKLRGLLYIPQVVSALPYLIHRAYEGDWAPYAGTTLQLAAALERVVARGASFAAICAEDVPGLTEAAIRRDTQGTYLGDAQVRRYEDYCKAWGPAGPAPKDFYLPVRSQVPALLISGVLDPATPPETAKQAAHDLPNSRLVAVKQGTHGTGSACVDGLIAEFVKRGSAAELDTSCTDSIHLPAFLAPPAGGGGR